MSLDAGAIYTFLSDELDVDTSEIEESSELFSSGIIDSFSLVSLLTFVEQQANFRIAAHDVNLDNFDSVSRILRYVEKATE